MRNNRIQLNPEFFQGHPTDLPYLNPHHQVMEEQGKQYTPESLSPPPPSPPHEPNKFYQQFTRIYSVSHHLHTQKKRLNHLVQDLLSRIEHIQHRINMDEPKPKESKPVDIKEQNQSDENRSKRARRTAQEIQKRFKCDVEYCQRFYGSEGSLQQHIKLKHPHLLHRDSSDQYVPNNGDQE